MQSFELDTLMKDGPQKHTKVRFKNEFLLIDVVYILPDRQEKDAATLNLDESKELYIFLKEIFGDE